MGIAWNELISPDVAGSREFYTALLGWATREEAMPGGGAYTLFLEGDRPVAGLMMPPDADTPAPLWFAYLAVDDADAAVEKAAGLGAKVLRAPFDIPGVARIAIIADPSGAAVGLYRAAG